MKQGIDSLGVDWGFNPPNNRKFFKEPFWLIDRLTFVDYQNKPQHITFRNKRINIRNF